MNIDDEEEDYIDFNQGNDEPYTGRVTRSQTGSSKPTISAQRKAQLKASKLKSVDVLRALQNARIDKHARYHENDKTEEITPGKTVRVSEGPHSNLSGLVKSVTKNGADVEVLLKNRIKIINFSKKKLEVVGTGAGARAITQARPIKASPLPTIKTLPVAGTFPVAAEAPGQQTQAKNMAYNQPPAVPIPGLVADSIHTLPVRPTKGASPHRPSEGMLPAISTGGASPGRQNGHSSEPKIYSIPRPQPSHAYMMMAHQQPVPSSISCPLLVILDLNGTLLFRKNKGSSFVPRPHLDEFLEYLFSNHVVMVWSSAKPGNVNRMCQNFFTEEQYQRVAAIWTRDNLRLSQQAYFANTQVYKQLSWVWQDHSIQSKNLVPGGYWDQSNTVLLDDSVEKSASEPYNLIRIEEFENRPDQANEDVLPQVALYLDTLRAQQNVSAYIRTQPFAPDRSMPRAAAEAFEVARYAAMGRSS